MTLWRLTLIPDMRAASSFDAWCGGEHEAVGTSGTVNAVQRILDLRQANRESMASRGVVVHLDSPLERLLERTRRDRKLRLAWLAHNMAQARQAR